MIKTALITGGSRGIGAEAVRQFTAAGYDTVFTYLSSEDEADELTAETGAAGFKADAGNPTDMNSAVEFAEREMGHIDVLVANAGIALTGLVTDHTDVQLDRLFKVDALGPIYAARAALPSMIRRKSGSIITVSSIWGITGGSCEVAYSAAKGAVIAFTKALAKEVGPSGIRVNCIAPGVIDTDMNGNLTDADVDALIDETPLMRIGTPLDVAKLMLFLAGEDSGFITGQIISPNGGIIT